MHMDVRLLSFLIHTHTVYSEKFSCSQMSSLLHSHSFSSSVYKTAVAESICRHSRYPLAMGTSLLQCEGLGTVEHKHIRHEGIDLPCMQKLASFKKRYVP